MSGKMDPCPPLHDAVIQSNLDLVRQEIQNGADVNELWDGIAPLHRAVCRSLRLVQLLITNGADILVKTPHNQETILHWASVCNTDDSHAIIKLLLDSGLDCNAQTSIDQVTPLLRALAVSDSLENVKLLLDYGADITAVDWDGSTAVHFAAKNRCVDMIELVLGRGFDIECSNRIDFTALHYAAIVDNSAVCEFLLKRGAMVNKLTAGAPGFRHTPLTLGINGSEQTVAVLLKYGANVLDKWNGKTILKMAEGQRSEQVAKLVIQRLVDMEFVNLSIDAEDRQLIESNPTYKRYYDESKETRFGNNIAAYRISMGSEEEIYEQIKDEQFARVLDVRDNGNNLPRNSALLRKSSLTEAKHPGLLATAACLVVACMLSILVFMYYFYRSYELAN